MAARPRGVISQQARGLDAGCHIGEGELVALIVSPLVHERAGFIDRRLADAERLPGDPDPPRIQRPHGDGEALPLRTEAVGLRHVDVLEDQLAGRRAVEAHLAKDLAHANASRIRRDQERGHSGCILVRPGPREDDVKTRVPDVGDENLGAVEHVAVAVAPRSRLQRCSVGS